MSTRIKFFRDGVQAQETRQFLNTHSIKSYIRERTAATVGQGEEAYGFDLYALRDEDVDNARQLLDYEFGGKWGETTP